jgi:AcrR family transcriptional regulator
MVNGSHNDGRFSYIRSRAERLPGGPLGSYGAKNRASQAAVNNNESTFAALNRPASNRSNLRAQKKSAARRQILEVARVLIETNGYQQTRMRDIAAAACISYQTLYNYFPGKSLIAQALLHQNDAVPNTSPTFPPLHAVMERSRAAGGPLADGACAQMRDVLERAIDALGSEHRGLWREVLVDALRGVGTKITQYPALDLLAPSGSAQLAESLRRAQAEGRLVPEVDIDVLAQVVCRIVDALLLAALTNLQLSRRTTARSLSEQLDLVLRPYLVPTAVEAVSAD